jgi:hypothetical protein
MDDDITEMGEDRLRTVCAGMKAVTKDDAEAIANIIATTTDLGEAFTDALRMAVLMAEGYSDNVEAHVDRMFHALTVTR